MSEQAVLINPAPRDIPRLKMSFEEFLTRETPETSTEWIDGEVVELSPVTDRHADIVSFLSALLRGFGDQTEKGITRGEPFVMRVQGDANGRSPDVLFLKSENRSRLKETFLDGPADLVIEVVSTGSIKTDYIEKRAEYERGGVPEYWIVDPLSNEVSFLLLDESGSYREAILDEQGLYAAMALDGLKFDPKWLRRNPLPKVIPILREWGLV